MLHTPVIAPTRALRDSPRTIPTPDAEPCLRTERLWQEYFNDRSQFWDLRTTKTNPKTPDFRHRRTKESLWIDGWHNPTWVKGMLEVKEADKARSGRLKRGKPAGRHAKQERAQSNDMRKNGSSPAVQLEWEMMSVDEAISNLDKTAGLPSIDKVIIVLQKCRKNKNLTDAKRAYVHVCTRGLESHRAIGNHIVPMFVECGSMPDAQHIFNSLVHRNEHSWTSLILGYVECGQSQHALNLYKEMQEDNVQPSSHTLMALSKACSRLKNLEQGREIHAEIEHKGFDKNVFVGNTLVDMYAKCGSLSEAREVFDNLPARDVVSWNALITGYTEHGRDWEALECLECMQAEGISPNAITMVCLLKACSNVGAIDKGREMHAFIAQKGFDRDLIIGNILVDMYAKCGSLSEAREVLDNLPARSVVSWTALIAGYAEHGPAQEALKCLERMQVEGVSPDVVTFVCTLKACGNLRDIDKGRELHATITQKGFERNIFVGNTLVDMYAKCGFQAEAQEVFDKLPFQDEVSWTALIAGYIEHGPVQEALKCFERMQLEGVSPSTVTFVYALKACGNIGAIDKGREVHAAITQRGFEGVPSIGTALVDMYCKCGSLSEAREVFDKLPVRDVMSWSTMIKGYGMNHQGKMAVQCFEDMLQQGVKPDEVTFTCLLTACSRAKLVQKGLEFFNALREKYGIVPTMDHYTCMVDLLAQSGHLCEADDFLETMWRPMSKEAWTALLSACKTYGEQEVGRSCFQHLVLMNPEDASPYVLMTNIYERAGRWDDAYRIEELRKSSGAKKKPARVLIEVNKKVHEFVVGNNESEEISAKLELLNSYIREEGPVPDKNVGLKSMFDEEKEAASGEHAEKWAIAFGLLNTPQGQTLRVSKNLRMCNDCHNASKVISRIEKREIIIRDIYHVHHFKDGLCSCEDMC